MNGRIAASALLFAAIVGCGKPADEPSPATSAASEGGITETKPPIERKPENKERGVFSTLSWLKDRQSTDGGWDGDVAATGLALLAFLGAGETHQSGSCRATVKNGLKWLRDQQDADGCYGPRTSPRFLRDHAVAALAMCEAYGMTGSRVFEEPAKRGVAFALTQTADDVETSGWRAMLFKSAILCGFDADGRAKKAIDDAVADLDKRTDHATGCVGATADGPDTAIALFVRVLAGHTPKDDLVLLKSADALLVGVETLDFAADPERTYIATQGIYQVGGGPFRPPDPAKRWLRWNAPMPTSLLARQRMDDGDPERGSWGPPATCSRVWATALCCMTLEVYYR